MRFHTCAILFVLFAVGALAQQPNVLINELLFLPDPANSDPNRTYDWVELYNAGTAGVDLTGWKIAAHHGSSGTSARTLPSVTLPAGKYLVVRFTSGTTSLDFSSGSANYYTGDNPVTPYWNSGSDEAALYSTTGIVDFISWSRSDLVYKPGTAHNDAVKAGIWTSGLALVSDLIGQAPELQREVSPGVSIGRDEFSTDYDVPEDFDAHGGRDADDISIGRQNLDLHTIVNQADLPTGQAAEARPAASQPATTTPKAWTVMLYVNGANNLAWVFWKALLTIQRAGASNANVNFVVMLAGTRVQLGILDSKGNPVGATNKGGNFRGLIQSSTVSYSNLVLQAPSGNLNSCPAGGSPGHVDLPALDMGDPFTLFCFIQWAAGNYPANHYALFLESHGDGWKGLGPDERFQSPGIPLGPFIYNPDFLYMGELSSGLATGIHLDLVAFLSCLMGNLEAAYQVAPYADWLVASEQIMKTPGYDFASLAAGLQAHPEWNGQQLGTRLVTDYQAFWSGRSENFWTLSLVNENQLAQLVGDVYTFGKALRTGVGLIQSRDDPMDNVQILISNDAGAQSTPGAFRFYDPNFMDLYDFASHIRNDPMIPDCVKTPAIQVMADFEAGTIVAAEVHSPSMPNFLKGTVGPANIKGLSIYMPIFRSGGPHHIETPSGKAIESQGYDYEPFSRISDGTSPLAVYAANHDLLPLEARDMETGVPLNRAQWPAPQTPNLRFSFDTGWSGFLERYYHPVADNHIQGAVAPNGDHINAVSIGGGACQNATDYISVPLNSTVTLSGAGSSDADMPPATTPFQLHLQAAIVHRPQSQGARPGLQHRGPGKPVRYARRHHASLLHLGP